MVGRDPILQILDLVADELDDLAALFADEVVVVRAADGDLVQRLLGVAEPARVSQACLLEQLHGAVHGCEPDPGLPAPRAHAQRLQVDVILALEKRGDDGVARPRCVEPALSQEDPPDELRISRSLPLGISFARARCHATDSAALPRASQSTMAPLLVALALTIGCGGGATTTDATAAADAGGGEAPVDVSNVVDVVVPDSADAAGPADAAVDAWPADFVAIAPCPEPAAYVATSLSISTLANQYSPACLRVPAGSIVTIEASVTHPLEPRPGGSAGNPIPAQLGDATVVFATPGLYPFVCPEHVDQGMLGVVWVTAR